MPPPFLCSWPAYTASSLELVPSLIDSAAILAHSSISSVCPELLSVLALTPYATHCSSRSSSRAHRV